MILDVAAGELTRLARGVHSCLFEHFEAVPICCIGGVFRSKTMRADFAAHVKRDIGCDISRAIHHPAAGAVLEALRLDDNGSELSFVPESET